MRIKKIIDRDRRDFTAVYGCEHCGHEHEGSGYDDRNFHHNVVPQLECQECGKHGTGEAPMTPRYPEGLQV